MTVNLTIDPATETRLLQLAQAAGKDLDQYLSELIESAAPGVQPSTDAADDFERAMDELFSGDHRELPRVSSTYSRQDIYDGHD